MQQPTKVSSSRRASPRGQAARAIAVLAAALLILALPALAIQRTRAAPTAGAREVYLPLALLGLRMPDDQPDYVRFAVIGDYANDSATEAKVSAMVKSWNPGFVVTVGDNNYGPDKVANIDRRVGQYYGDYIFPYRGAYGGGADSNRFYPALGNHDWNSDGLTAYLGYFTLPSNERYYQATRGPVSLIVLDSDPNEPDGVTSDSAQGRWLQRTLAASQSCWKLVIFHHSPFSSGEQGPSAWMQWPFRAWGADAVLGGHDHIYERLSVDGLPYFVNGLGGTSRYSLRAVAPGSVVRYNDTFGAMLVEARPASITYRFIAIDGTVVDTYTQTGGCGA